MEVAAATAVMDASIAYGASRWYRGLHQDPKWEYADKYKAADDQRLFNEFLHNLLLYDRIVLDKSSVTTVAQELAELFSKINTQLCREVLAFDKLTEESTLAPVQRSVCELIRGVLDGGVRTESELTRISMPWAYHSPHHHDYPAFVRHVEESGLAGGYIPLAIYAFRAICYSGFANDLSRRSKAPVVYLASPGRMAVMSRLLDTNDFSGMRYPLTAYRDLMGRLKLPSKGYSFEHLRSVPPAQVSGLALAVAEKSPRESLRFTLDLRERREAKMLRKDWADRVWAKGLSSAIGATGEQTVSNATVHGPVTMIQIHGVAAD
jgi:hypothetical protein